MNNEFDSMLAAATAEVVESMCFMDLVSEASEPKGRNVTFVAADIEFHGMLSGRFGISAPLEVARTMATNFLGEDGTMFPEPRVGDVIGEIANMICGSVLSRCEPVKSFEISPPDIHFLLQEIQDAGTVCHHVYQLDGGTLRVWLKVEPAP